MPETTTMQAELMRLIAGLIEAGIPPDAIGGQMLIAANACFAMAGGGAHAVARFEDATTKLRQHHQAAPPTAH